eukprot:TRINITY_DN1493_c0_g1_i1.p1 TRINITY_DN1493_c0_g1~~TRINITY_DN1493_c0_g1_i1.p1  ORF type:complete len:875 (-),score=351.55 TRINITY_DN1493_c0_g1_i1:66-2690(-)
MDPKTGKSGELLFNCTPPSLDNLKSTENWFSGLVWDESQKPNSPVSNIEIGTSLFSKTDLTDWPFLFGLGEHKGPLNILATQQKASNSAIFSPRGNEVFDGDTARIRLFNRHGKTGEEMGTHGSHPFYIQLHPETGTAHGVFLLNSNNIEVDIRKHALSFRASGGIIDLFLFPGSTPELVVQQYQKLVGKPFLPPYWSFGFFHSRHGNYKIQDLHEVVDKYAKANIPLEGVWLDHQIQDALFQFSTSKGFSVSDVDALIKKFHKQGMRVIAPAGPAVKSDRARPEFEAGIHDKFFIKEADSLMPAFSKLAWGTSAFPDFTHPNVTGFWWYTMRKFLTTFPVDGLFLTDNEPFSECNGICDKSTEVLQKVLCEESDWPPNLQYPLVERALPMNSRYYISSEYNLHNLYGYLSSMATKKAFEAVRPPVAVDIGKSRQQRALVMSRSTFSGSGHYSGHWIANTQARMTDIRSSLANVLRFNLLGIPFVGADLCGWEGETDGEECTRWLQVGAFFPFTFFNRPTGSKPQELYEYLDSTIISSREALFTKYKLLPYYYTLFADIYVRGGAALRPLFYEFPSDSNVANIENQFMVGEAIMISAATVRNPYLNVYFPKIAWYNFYNGSRVILNEISNEQKEMNEISASEVTNKKYNGFKLIHTPTDNVNVHVRGGYIIPLQATALTTAASRRNPFELIVALSGDCYYCLQLDNCKNCNDSAKGYLYLDDGESVQAIESNIFSLMEYKLELNVEKGGFLSSKSLKLGYSPPYSKTMRNNAMLETISIFGWTKQHTSHLKLCIAGRSIPTSEYNYNSTTQVLNIYLHQRITNDFKIIFISKSQDCDDINGSKLSWRTGLLVFAVLFALLFACKREKKQKRHPI